MLPSFGDVIEFPLRFVGNLHPWLIGRFCFFEPCGFAGEGRFNQEVTLPNFDLCSLRVRNGQFLILTASLIGCVEFVGEVDWQTSILSPGSAAQE